MLHNAAMAVRRAGMVLAVAGLAAVIAPPAHAQEIELPHQKWSFDGPFGTFDRASAQRGFQIYNQVCSNCHSLKEAYYRNLEGIGLTEDQIKAVISDKTMPSIGDDGTPADRPALVSDHFHSPFANDKAARAANNGALPPDQSVIEKAREGGADYIDALLQGYGDPPAGMKIGDGLYYNKYFPGHQIAMPQPLQDDAVEYSDGTKATLAQEAHDITTFLTYIANPEMEQRKQMGVKIVLFLVGMTCVTYAVKRKIWSDVH
jgi:ubiquinol-cytochrome c reductase cytochrome c1 subunit